MSLNLEIKRLNLTDLIMYQCGYESCCPNHSYGPAVRDHFLIHYILDGRGTFYVNNQTHILEKGQGFLICPDVITFYEADADTPWTYCWVGFHGLKASWYLEAGGLSKETPIFTATQPDYISYCFNQMLSTKKLKSGKELRLLGILYELLSELIEENTSSHPLFKRGDRREEYIKMAVQYIEMNYSRKVTVAEIAHHLGLDRSYLCYLFKQTLSKSPQKFLVEYRMNKAIELMSNPLLSLGDIARSVGYNDVLSFSKIFSKTKGMAPSYYQNNLLSCCTYIDT